jgi:hypothetical protein
MDKQNFKNHTRLVPMFHFVAFTAALFPLVITVIHFINAVGDGSGRLHAAASVSLVLAVILGLWYSRVFALRAQDRAIRAEENFRHFLATGKPLDSRITMRQIIGLRFGDNDEFVELAKRAVEENLSEKQIKMAVKKWKADHHRA